VAINHIHVFESRKTTFRDDDVLQENVIVRLGRNQAQGPVFISSSNGPTFADYTEHQVSFDEVVQPSDQEKFIRVPATSSHESAFPFTGSLRELGIDVATGPVVELRGDVAQLRGAPADLGEQRFDLEAGQRRELDGAVARRGELQPGRERAFLENKRIVIEPPNELGFDSLEHLPHQRTLIYINGAYDKPVKIAK